MRKYLILATFITAACSGNKVHENANQDLVEFVEQQKTGMDIDYWIEMQNIAGEWEKTVLVFGYLGDFEECEKAMSGLKSANSARKYRCVPAQQN